eukprot:522662-Prorocentrum_minimum.AAC.2
MPPRLTALARRRWQEYAFFGLRLLVATCGDECLTTIGATIGSHARRGCSPPKGPVLVRALRAAWLLALEGPVLARARAAWLLAPEGPVLARALGRHLARVASPVIRAWHAASLRLRRYTILVTGALAKSGAAVDRHQS